VGEAGIDLVMSMIELDRTELGARRYDTIHFGDFCRLSGFGVSAAEGAHKAVSIGHVTDELYGVIKGLAEPRTW